MGNAGQLKVTLTSEHAQFSAGMKQAAESVDGLTKKIFEGVNAHEQFNAKMFTSREALRSFGEIGGVSTHAMRELSGAFMSLPGPLGIALGAVMAFKMALDAQEESMKRAAEMSNDFKNVMKSTGEILGETHAWDGYSAKATESVEKIEEAIKKLNIDIEANLKPYLGGNSFQARKDREMINTLQEQEYKVIELRDVFEGLNKAMDDAATDKFTAKMNDGKGMLQALTHEADALQEALAKIPEGTREWKGVTNSLRAVQLEMHQIAGEATKAQEKIVAAFMNMTQTPQEKFDEGMKSLNQAIAAGLDSTHADIAKKMLEAQLKASESIAPKFNESHDGGLAHAFTKRHVALEAAQANSHAMINELKAANKHLAAIAKGVKAPTAPAVMGA